ncbi:WD40 repeat-like protein [Puccinia graminis f. sp. tritici]|uniref:WD40 repeat-like protein n=1 Tax=Puccinia graminis f. sp. tritici TaxID=56615 RepID=A0A5B0NTW7_PUCGR|nr:WD40 repeat-like protein [Puccinia graminis f. sp. tritici]KAA1091570.1 WD40 repeat-like protein [Puccinia graminis f. sp. tritici]
MAATPISLWAPSPDTGERGTAIKLDSNGKGSIVYAAGRSIFIKNLDTLESVSYSGHVRPTTVAKFAPSGFYVASGDSAGSVRVWDIAGDEQILKVEVKAISGKINDLAWDAENGGKRIVAVGEGRERFGHAFTIDGGNSVGEIAGHSKTITSVCVRSARPFRAVTGSDDTTLVFFNGTPYKFSKTIRTHSRFVQTVEYAKDGSLFASGGSDSKLFIYDGSTGDTICQLGGEDAAEKHTGTVYSIGWSKAHPSTLASFSADGKVMRWDASTQKHVGTWKLADSPSPEQQLIGGTWLEGNRLVSLAYNGDLTILDDRQSEPVKKIYSCQKGIIAAAKCPKTSGIFAGDHSGRVFHYSNEGVCKPVGGSASSKIIGLSTSQNKVFSISMDDSVREIDPSEAAYNTNVAVPLPAQGKDLCARSTDNVILVITANEARLIESGNSLTTIPLDYNATACAISPKFAAIGAADGKVYVYDASSKTLKSSVTLSKNISSVTCMAISPDEKLLAVGEQNGKIMIYELSGEYPVKISQWCWHTARIMSFDWSACSAFLASSSLDTNIYVWSVAKPAKNIPIKNAHVGGTTEVIWEAEGKLSSCGSDGAIRKFSIKLDSLT